MSDCHCAISGPGCVYVNNDTYFLLKTPKTASKREAKLNPPYQLVTSLSLALSGAAARPAPAAPGIITTVSDGLMAPTDAGEIERVGFVLQKLSISPTLYEAPNRPEPAEHSSPGSVESAPGCGRPQCLVPSSNPVAPDAGRVGSPELPGLPSLAGDFGEAVVAAGTDDIAAVTATLQNIRLGFAQGAAATRVQRAMRARSCCARAPSSS